MLYVSLCVGASKGKPGTKPNPEQRNTTKMYPGKVMHIIAECINLWSKCVAYIEDTDT